MDLLAGLAGPVYSGHLDDIGGGHDSEKELFEEALDDCLVSEPRAVDHVSVVHRVVTGIMSASALLLSCLFHPPTPHG
ncbi:MAG: hypothetical protein OEV08_12920 [Nitrospira sp.]|nr:hypothetical protein [Nitrospira sp.]